MQEYGGMFTYEKGIAMDTKPYVVGFCGHVRN